MRIHIKRKFSSSSVGKNRNIIDVIISAEVKKALKKWISSIKKYVETKPTVRKEEEGVLIGGLAMALYTRPRYTQDVDILFLHREHIPDKLDGFIRHRKLAFKEKSTHVEVEVVDSTSFSNLPQSLVDKVFDTAVIVEGMLVASKEGLVCLKLYAGRTQDEADIVAILKEYPDTKITGWPTTKEQKELLKKLKLRAIIEKKDLQDHEDNNK
jgi:hypothetical protein